MLAIAVALAAGLGAVARYLLDQTIEHKTTGTFPAGTLLVNLTGSLLLGVVVGLGLHHGLSNTPSVVPRGRFRRRLHDVLHLGHGSRSRFVKTGRRARPPSTRSAASRRACWPLPQASVSRCSDARTTMDA